jgi:hypothetical protein
MNPDPIASLHVMDAHLTGHVPARLLLDAHEAFTPRSADQSRIEASPSENRIPRKLVDRGLYCDRDRAGHALRGRAVAGQTSAERSAGQGADSRSAVMARCVALQASLESEQVR